MILSSYYAYMCSISVVYASFTTDGVDFNSRSFFDRGIFRLKRGLDDFNLIKYENS